MADQKKQPDAVPIGNVKKQEQYAGDRVVIHPVLGKESKIVVERDGKLLWWTTWGEMLNPPELIVNGFSTPTDLGETLVKSVIVWPEGDGRFDFGDYMLIRRHHGNPDSSG